MKTWAIGVWMCAAAAGAKAQGVELPHAAAPLVHLNVVAKDSRGQPLTDLTRDDFQVFEGSKAQRVVSFRRNDGSVKRVVRAEANEFSNRSGTPMTRATVILFDLLNARFEDRGYMVNQLVPALQHIEGSDTLFFYILSMRGTLYTVHGIPAGDRAPAADARPWTDDIKALMDDAARELFKLRPTEIDVDTRVRMTYRAMEELADVVAAVPGRKSLIWISHGVPISLGPGNTSVYDTVDYTPLLRRLTSTLDRDQVAVYTVRQPASMRPAAESADARSQSGNPAADGPGLSLSTEDTLEQFAQLTGGHAFMTPDIRGAIALAASDARMSYLISYEPSLANWDGKYHKIRVTCARKGAKIETKQGYYAYANQAAEGDQEKTAIEMATTSGFDSTEIGVFARMTEHEGTRNVEMAIRVDPADINASEGSVAIGVAGYLKDGRMEMFPMEEVAAKAKAEKRLVLSEGVERLRVLVYDRGSGAVGSLTIPVGKK